ncbi:hypothetical protein IVB05_42360 [Bradyrhizobium sp. 170]|nr:hypothetical protein IVB05_42360 [Bradyrhizobium sp. 170]
MLRSFTAVVILVSCFTATGWAQAPSPTSPVASTPSKPVTKKTAPKAKTAAKQPVAAATGPCRLGVISALGDHFAVQKFGLTIFETEESAVTIEGWGLDDLVVARIRAATGSDPAVRRISYPKAAFEPFYHPTSRFLPDPREGLPAIVRSITSAANCERYLVVTRFKGQVPGTKLTLDGIGAYSHGLGSLVRHSHLFANVGLTLLDGSNYETISRPFAGLGTRLAEGLRLTEDPLTKLDNSLFPEPATTVPGNAMLRERTRALVAARLDQVLPNYLKND